MHILHFYFARFVGQKCWKSALSTRYRRTADKYLFFVESQFRWIMQHLKVNFPRNSRLTLKLKEALDKNDTYLFISNSTESLKLNHYWINFQRILPVLFHFMRHFFKLSWVFMNSFIFKMFLSLLYCAFIEVDFGVGGGGCGVGRNRNC